ncbi:metal-dependent hydrolase [Halostella sp. PRR32]|uniref:metal-dependent hydrolase n=1 Tax=Halostella sp. PRR32 TaxID=3098147 RepID=UPI002B1DDA67|nr:metal-dependent hydrolase [Halostella sp. PRR32]
MMVGHALLAFALVAGTLSLAGRSRERALSVGLIAAGFAVVPDADMVYALAGLLDANYDSVFSVTEAFWETSTVVHRSVTHSLVVAVPAAVAFGLWTAESRVVRASAAALAVALVTAAHLITGPLAALVMVAFLVSGFVVSSLADSQGKAGPVTVFGAAVVGIWSHPWGDMFTGEPPHLFYPLTDSAVVERVALSPDPTLHLLGAFGLEIATLWLAALVYCHISNISISENVNRRAALGVVYGVAVLAIDPPTLSVSYQFVFSIVAVGILAAVPFSRARFRTRFPGDLSLPDRMTTPEGVLRALLTGLAGLTAALLAYTAAYVLFV